MTRYFSSFLSFGYILISGTTNMGCFFRKKNTAIQKKYYFCNVIKV